MAARAEMSSSAQGTEPQSGAPPKGMSVALIGPNDAHRQVVAKALASGDGRKVHEFIDYPATLNELARMMETRFDVVLVDVDTDESYALQIITKLAQLGPAVMAYSARTDDDLVASCMRAGASDFLPLPREGGAGETAPAAERPAAAVPPPAPKAPLPPAPPKPVAAAAPAPPKPAAVVPPPPSRPIEPRPTPVSQSSVVPTAPPKFEEPAEDPWSTRVPETRPVPQPEKAIETLLKAEAPARTEAPVARIETQAKIDELDILKEEAKSDFAAWDAANLRRASMPPVTRPDSRPRPSLVPEKRKNIESITRAVPPVDEPVREAAPPPPPAPPIERPPISSDIFRSTTFHAEPSEAAEKQGAKWVKWVLIAAGPVVLGLVLLVVFTRSSAPNTPAAVAAKEAPAPAPVSAPEQPDPSANSRLIVNATGKAGDNPAKTPKPNAGQPEPAATDTQTDAPKQVSPDAMAAQLVAPSRIAGQIKSGAADEPPPAAPAPVSLDDNNSVAGAVFGAGSKVKASAPHVVPISAGLAAGMLIHKTPPVYPKFAQDTHITGTVVMKATITKQGTIEGIQVLSGPKILASPAVDAVKTWKYRPYVLDGQPVAVETNITVVFGGAR